MINKQNFISDLIDLAPVVPVLIISEIEHAVPLARALVAGGLKAIEVTLRTPIALEAIRAIAGEVEGCVPGVGTVLNANDLRNSEKAGAQFAVSPGAGPMLLDAADDSALPLLPGAASASEAMTFLERGYRFQKFFPAEAAGGAGYLKSLASPLPAITFCPTGGIDLKKAEQYLALPNVKCVGGSWVAPADKVLAGDWDGIESLSRGASSLGR